MTLSTSRLWIVPGLAALLLLAFVPPAPLHAQGLGTWVPSAGPGPDYELGGNPEAKHGSPDGGYIRSLTPAPGVMGYLRAQVPPGPYLGKRVRLSGFAKTENVEGWAALSIRVEGPNGVWLATDTMEDRQIVGTTDWRKYDLVVDVPASSTNIRLRMGLVGAGKAWVNGVTLDVVGPEVALTGRLAWFPTGANPEDYEMGGNPGVAHGAAGGGYIRSKGEAPRTFGTWASQIPVGSFLGKRVRLSGYVRSEGVEKWAGIWMRVDGPGYEVLSFDNMQDRPIKGTTDWTKYAVVLDVPARAVNVMFGLILEGSGKAWFDGVTLEPVATDVPPTNMVDPYTEYYEGRYAEAAKLFPDMTARMPASYSLKLLHFLALHRSGQAQEARAYINGVAASLTDQKWAGPVVLFYAGKLPEDDVLKAAASADPTTDKEQRCEAYYYLAMAHLLTFGNVRVDDAAAAAKAREYLEKCVATGVTNFVEYRAAKAELGRLKK